MSQQPGHKLYLPHQPGKQPRLPTVAPAPYLNMLRAPHLNSSKLVLVLMPYFPGKSVPLL